MSDLVRITIGGWSYMVSEDVAEKVEDVILNPDNYIAGLDEEEGDED